MVIYSIYESFISRTIDALKSGLQNDQKHIHIRENWANLRLEHSLHSNSHENTSQMSNIYDLDVI